jgi:beta-lactamase regulating signal transducer with metallopeptidase domain
MIDWLLESTIIVALLAVVITVVCRLGRCSPAVCHALWLVVLVKLLLPPVVTSPVNPWRFVSASSSTTEGLHRSTGTSSEASAGGVQGSGFRVQDAAPVSIGDSPRISDEIRGIIEREQPSAVTTAAAWWTENWIAIRRVLQRNVESALFYVALLAAGAIALRQGVWLVRITRLGQRGREAPKWLQREVSGVAAVLRVGPPRIVVVNAIRTPFVWCLGRPRLFWPEAIAQTADPGRWRGVIAHELAHLRRRDHLVAWLILAAEWLWWWNPVFWYVRSRLRDSAELACDAWAVSVVPVSRQDYAETIVEVTELLSKTALPMPALRASSGARRTFKRRLTMILCERVPCKLTWPGLMAAVVLALVALPSWLFAQAPPDKRGAAAAAQDGDKRGKSSSEVIGTVQSVEAGKRTITVVGKQLERTLTLAKEVRVVLDDGTGDKFGFEAGQLADVAEGAPVILRLSPDQKEVVGIWVEGPTLKGILKSVDADKPSITVTVAAKGEPEQEKTFDVSKNAKLTISQDKGKDKDKDSLPKADQLADLPPGAIVMIKLSADQNTVGRIQVEVPSVHGTLKAADAAARTLTVSVAAGKGEPAEDRTFTLAEQAAILVDGAAGKLSELPPDTVVILKLSLDQKEVAGVLAEGPKIQGTLKALDADKRTLTIHVVKTKGEPGEDRTIDVAKSVKVTLDKSSGELADLPTDVVVTVRLSVDQKQVASIHVEGPTYHGEVKVVDAGSRSITIADKEGEKTFSVDEAASIIIDEKPQKLADLPVEAHAAIKLSADQKTVLGINAGGRKVEGIIKAIDAANREITLELPKDGDMKFKLAEEVKIFSGDKAKSLSIPLADLKPDVDAVLVLSADQKLVRQIVLLKD